MGKDTRLKSGRNQKGFVKEKALLWVSASDRVRAKYD